jgi:hypothetical protein
MSKQVTLSDTFYQSLNEHLEALVKFAQNPTEENQFNFSSLPSMYEYDTKVYSCILDQFDKIRSTR